MGIEEVIHNALDIFSKIRRIANYPAASKDIPKKLWSWKWNESAVFSFLFNFLICSASPRAN